MIYVVTAAFLLVAGLATYYGMTGRGPCLCPLPMRAYLMGERCPLHGGTTEAAYPTQGAA